MTIALFGRREGAAGWGITERATRPNQLWRVDLTEHRTAGSTLYACAIRDDYSNKIVDYAIGDRMKQAWSCGRYASPSRCDDRLAPRSFGPRQRIPIPRLRWHTGRQQPRRIERTYHRRRRQRALGKLTAIEFEMLHQQIATAA